MEIKPLVVVLDLDETLIHTTHKKIVHHDGYFPTENEKTYIRKGAIAFIKKLLREPNMRVMIWTSANQKYALHVIKGLGFSEADFARVWHSTLLNKRELDINDLQWGEFNYRNEKDLLKVRRSLKTSLRRIVAIDDNYRFFEKQYSNTMIVPPYTGQDDDILEHAFDYLIALKKQDNIRKVEKRGWLNSYMHGHIN